MNQSAKAVEGLVTVQSSLNGLETSKTLLLAELYVAKLSLKCPYLFGDFCKFLAPEIKLLKPLL